MWSAATLVTPPASPAIALEQVKEFVRVDADTTDFDAQLTGFIASAIDHIERSRCIRLAPQKVELLADDWCDLARLPVGPVTQIESIKYLDSAGAEQTLAGASYELAGAELERSVRPSAGSSWPSDLRPIGGAIRLIATVGYAELPPTLLTAALTLTADIFAFRETAVVGTVAAKIPVSTIVNDWLDNYRIWL